MLIYTYSQYEYLYRLRRYINLLFAYLKLLCMLYTKNINLC